MLPRLGWDLHGRIVADGQDRGGIVAAEAERGDGTERAAEASSRIDGSVIHPQNLRGADEVILIDSWLLGQALGYAGIEYTFRGESQSAHVKGRSGCRICGNAG